MHAIELRGPLGYEGARAPHGVQATVWTMHPTPTPTRSRNHTLTVPGQGTALPFVNAGGLQKVPARGQGWGEGDCGRGQL